MTDNHSVNAAVKYYEAMDRKDLATVQGYLHPEVEFIGPMAQDSGKERILEMVRNFSNMFTRLTVKEKFGSGDQAVLIYEVECPAPIGTVRAAVLVTFAGDLIKRFELFYNSKPFESKKEEIFSHKK